MCIGGVLVLLAALGVDLHYDQDGGKGLRVTIGVPAVAEHVAGRDAVCVRAQKRRCQGSRRAPSVWVTIRLTRHLRCPSPAAGSSVGP